MTFEVTSYTKFQNFTGPHWGAYSAPPDPAAGGEGARCPLPKNLTPTLGLRPAELHPIPVTPPPKINLD